MSAKTFELCKLEKLTHQTTTNTLVKEHVMWILSKNKTIIMIFIKKCKFDFFILLMAIKKNILKTKMNNFRL